MNQNNSSTTTTTANKTTISKVEKILKSTKQQESPNLSKSSTIQLDNSDFSNLCAAADSIPNTPLFSARNTLNSTLMMKKVSETQKQQQNLLLLTATTTTGTGTAAIGNLPIRLGSG